MNVSATERTVLRNIMSAALLYWAFCVITIFPPSLIFRVLSALLIFLGANTTFSNSLQSMIRGALAIGLPLGLMTVAETGILICHLILKGFAETPIAEDSVMIILYGVGTYAMFKLAHEYRKEIKKEQVQ